MNEAAIAAPKQTPVMETFARELHAANTRTINVVHRLTDLNAKIWGVSPESGANVKKDEVQPTGLVSVLQCDIKNLHGHLDSAEELLGRLEQLV